MIPKIIHYCWFGGNPKPEIIEKCIESWRKYCPDWDIKEWNESNYDINAHPYVKEAYGAKKWAFVSDVARLETVYKHGGVYLDTDVELSGSLDRFIENDAFYIFETDRNINSGLGFGAKAGHCSLKEMLISYEGRHFIVKGKQDLSPCPAKNTEALCSVYPDFRRNGKTQLIDGCLILSGGEYVSFAHHHSTGLWGDGLSSEDNTFVFKDTKLKRILRKPEYIDWIEKHLGKRVSSIYTFLVYDFLDLGVMYYIKRYSKRLINKISLTKKTGTKK